MNRYSRVAHSPKNYVQETFIKDFMDFVLWGHEHECRITPERSEQQGFDIIQPGSSVATSLSEGESVPKFDI